LVKIYRFYRAEEDNQQNYSNCSNYSSISSPSNFVAVRFVSLKNVHLTVQACYLFYF